MNDFLAKLISIPFFLIFIAIFCVGLFGTVTKQGWRVPFFSLQSLFMRAFLLLFSWFFFVIATKLWN